jgi:peroxiredoxin
MKNKIIWVGLVLFLLGIGFAGSSLFFKSTKIAPEVMFTTITGKNISLKALQGKPVIVTFWATDCLSCMKEIPHLIALYQQFHQQGLEIIAVAMAYNPPNLVVNVAKTRQMPYHVALDLRSKLAKAFGDVNLIPRTFLISPNGQIVLDQLGMFDLKRIKKYVENYFSG